MVTQRMVRAVFRALNQAGMTVECETGRTSDGCAAFGYTCERWEEVWERLAEAKRWRREAREECRREGTEGPPNA